MESTCRSYCFTGFETAVVIDVETTGLDPQNDRVVSVAALKTDFRTLVSSGEINASTLASRINPGCPIPAKASAVHGIYDADVQDEPAFAEIAGELREFIGDCRIIGHNVQFDKRFLSAEFKRAGVKALGRTKSHCTMQRMKEHLGHLGKGFRKVNLETAASHFGINGRRSTSHDALEDAQLALQVAAAFYALDNGKSPWPTPRRDGAPSQSASLPPEGSHIPGWVIVSAVAAVLAVALVLAIIGQ